MKSKPIAQAGPRREVALKRDTDYLSRYLSGPSPIGAVVSPGIYAGRIGERVKIGCSLNLPQRTAAFEFDELLAVLPIHVSRHAGEPDAAYAFRVRDVIQQRERALHTALAAFRLRLLSRSNANEWFAFNDELLRVLFAHGAVVARARVTGRPLGRRLNQIREL